MDNPTITSSWTDKELAYFKIVFKDVDAQAFFDKTSLPPPSVPAAILQNAEATPSMTYDELDFFSFLKHAMEERGACVDFVCYLCRLFRYHRPARLICMRKSMPFVMGGKTVIAKADVTIITRDEDKNFRFIAQGNKHEDKAAAKLMAECIAAFHHNAHAHASEDVQPLQSQVIPGFTIVGSTVVFYRAPITKELLEAVSSMTRPSEETVVLRLVPPVPELASYNEYGMTRVENRLPVMQCFEALKDLLGMPP